MKRLITCGVALSVGAWALAAMPAAAQAAVDPYAAMSQCAALGPKPPGSDAGRAQAERIAGAFRAANLQTSFEDFQLPVYVVRKTVLRTVGADARDVAGETFAYGASGTVEAEVVDVGAGRASDYAGVDAKGKVVMVRRDTAFHRSSQLSEVIDRGGAAMLYVSGSPDNLVQTGTVRFAQAMPSSIPAVTVGADDGARLQAQIRGGGLRMGVEVQAERQNAVARNVIGVRRGSTHPDQYVVVGGHYDNWHEGAIDNCTAVGSLLAVADAVKDVPLAYSVVFGAWDAEEVGLTGSYDYVQRHPDVVASTVFNENLEMTAAGASDAALRFGTSSPAMLVAANAAAAATGYRATDVPALAIRQISGGIIPTDLQPFYSAGVQGLSTFTNTAWYHTTADVPDKVDRASHARATAYLTSLLGNVQSIPPAALRSAREVPAVTVSAPPNAPPGAAVAIKVHVDDQVGRPLSGQTVRVLVNQRDNWAVAEGTARELGGGDYEYRIPAGATEADITRITATLNRSSDIAEGYAAVDQRGGGLLPANTAPCRPRRRITIRVRPPRRAGRVIRLSANATAGSVRIIGRRAVRVDTRGVSRPRIRVRVTARTSKRRLLRQTRTYPTCVTQRSLRLAVGGSE